MHPWWPYMANGWRQPVPAPTPATLTAAPMAMPLNRPMISETDIQRRMYLNQVSPDLRDRAAVWQEYKNTDQRLYYYNSKTLERTWNKPEIIKELDDAIAVIKEHKAKKAIEEAKAQEGQYLKQQQGEVNKVGTSITDDDHKRSDDSTKKSPNTAPLLSSSSSSSSAANSNPSTSSASMLSSSEHQSQKPQQQQSQGSGKQREGMRPVSTTAIPGTPWCVVWTDKNRVFYFNPSTKTSVWDRPAELRDREDVDKLVSNPINPNIVKAQQNNEQKTMTANHNHQLDDDSFTSDHDQANNNSNSSYCQPEKKIKLDPNPSSSDTNQAANPKPAIAPKLVKKEVTSEIEKEAAKKRETIPLEERIDTFRKMLEEKEVNPMSTFPKELSKIVFDPRYLLLTSNERKEVFEKYCLEKIEEERNRKREKMKKATDEFKSLLNDSNLTSRSVYDDFHARYSQDPRYRALERTKDREILFDDHLAYLRRKERDERSRQKSSRERDRRSRSRGHSHSRGVSHEEAEDIFHAMLVEFVTDPDLTWHDAKRILRKSPQWNLVEELPRGWREMVFERHAEKLYQRRKEKFQQLLSETKEITLNSEWRDVRRIIREDPRYIKFSSSDRRCEREFREFLKKKRAVAEDNFRHLLRETTLIDKDTRRKIEESENHHLIDIISTLQNDKRYQELALFSEERRKILLSYIEELAATSSESPAPITSSNDTIEKDSIVKTTPVKESNGEDNNNVSSVETNGKVDEDKNNGQ